MSEWRAAPRHCLRHREDLSPQQVYDRHFRAHGVDPAVFLKAAGIFERRIRAPLSRVRPTDSWEDCLRAGRVLYDSHDCSDLLDMGEEIKEEFEVSILDDAAPDLENFQQLVLYLDDQVGARGLRIAE